LTQGLDPLRFFFLRRFSSQSALEKSCPSAACGVARIAADQAGTATDSECTRLAKSDSPQAGLSWKVVDLFLMWCEVRMQASVPLAPLPWQGAAGSHTSFSWAGGKHGDRSRTRQRWVGTGVRACSLINRGCSLQNWTTAVVRMVARRRPLMVPYLTRCCHHVTSKEF
jgi:hypothetical protein